MRAIIEHRRRTRTDILTELRQMADDDPMTGDERQHGHLYLLVHAETAPVEALVELLARSDAQHVIQEIIGQIVRKHGLPETAPDVRQLRDRIPRAEGLALTSYNAEEGPRREQSLLELVIREDGGIRLICGRGTDAFPQQNFAPVQPPVAVIAVLVLGLTHCVAALAGRLSDEYAAYQGQWRLGIRMDRLRGAVPLDLLQGHPLRRPGNPYSRDEYEKVTSASTEELINDPRAVVERLVAPLLRGLGIAPRYLPYRP